MTVSWWGTGSQALGGTGSVTLTTLTTRWAVGAFSFNAASLAAGASGTRVVTSGMFDMTF